MSRKRILTLCVPVLNEESNISELLRRLRSVAEKLPNYETEFLFIDDGSTDNTFSILAAESSNDRSIKVVKLSRNFGHQAALSAGLHFARGDYFISLDADLQDPPELVLEMLERAERGDEIVYTVRRSREASVGMRALFFMQSHKSKLACRVTSPRPTQGHVHLQYLQGAMVTNAHHLASQLAALGGAPKQHQHRSDTARGHQ